MNKYDDLNLKGTSTTTEPKPIKTEKYFVTTTPEQVDTRWDIHQCKRDLTPLIAIMCLAILGLLIVDTIYTINHANFMSGYFNEENLCN